MEGRGCGDNMRSQGSGGCGDGGERGGDGDGERRDGGAGVEMVLGRGGAQLSGVERLRSRFGVRLDFFGGVDGMCWAMREVELNVAAVGHGGRWWWWRWRWRWRKREEGGGEGE
eukprot:TRINITY_DN36174_c0_g1_i1.p2 TRINITY_DN36174_c0_g1~~TRINITY_DN36174_c0_g1_i1.p2  ORF type:complete len:114 (-),score=47.99 TRINITY_DN36174_c0_g1_i1:156-497(-)